MQKSQCEFTSLIWIKCPSGLNVHYSVKSGPKVSNGEAKTRLRQVNHLVGNILNQGQRAQEQLVDSSYVLRGTKGDLASGSDHLKNSKRLLEKVLNY